VKTILSKFLPAAIALLLGLPLAGAAIAGKPLARYFEFPPRSQYVVHADFSWIVFVLMAAFIAACVAPFIVHVFRRPRLGWVDGPEGSTRVPRVLAGVPPASSCGKTGGTPISSTRDACAPHSFPAWGWIGLLLGAVAWIIAWNRFAWVGAFQYHTFTPLWLSYIVVVNALAYRRTGHCLMLDRPRVFLLLFPLSAGFWWFFEYLNRYVQNWHYSANTFGAQEYFWYATLPFSTVLAAVMGTREWLASFPVFRNRFQDFAPVALSRHTGRIILVAASLILAGIGVFPNQFYPFLWMAPLLILVAFQLLAGEWHVFEGLTRGDWRLIVTSALAALICGFFWEMWNVNSLAKWYYTVPYVDRFHLFEMPILGYAGYLPFGVECLAVGSLVASNQSET
jgi:hypothetical protein